MANIKLVSSIKFAFAKAKEQRKKKNIQKIP
jgi:hypothetical protein